MDQRPLALVTGGTDGIGLELARQFAMHGFDLVVAGRPGVDHGPAEAVLRRLGARVEVATVDLATPTGVEALAARVGARPLAAAAFNVGAAAGGPFVTGPGTGEQLGVVDLNVRGTVHLAKLLLPGMAARGSGRVLFSSSIAANTPGAFNAVYNASKSFVQSFALALREELRDSGVTVTALMPAPTDTGLFAKAGMLDTLVGSGPKNDPADVAAAGFAALMAGQERATPGLFAKAEAVASRFVPDALKAAVHRRMAEPGSGRR